MLKGSGSGGGKPGNSFEKCQKMQSKYVSNSHHNRYHCDQHECFEYSNQNKLLRYYVKHNVNKQII